MVEIKHTPRENSDNRYLIIGDNIEELVEFCLFRIRERSKEYYRKELLNDLQNKGSSLIDVHAGMGNSYTVELSGENGCRARATRFLQTHNIDPEIVELFVESNWIWVLSNEQNLARFNKWLKK